MKKVISVHNWVTRKGVGGKKVERLVLEGKMVREIYRYLPGRDIKHTTICIFGVCFTIVWVWNRKLLDYYVKGGE